VCRIYTYIVKECYVNGYFNLKPMAILTLETIFANETSIPVEKSYYYYVNSVKCVRKLSFDPNATL
jgi:hypothetical protein